ncbi:hypothetical protein [Brevifollis gellanilyticus]|uniref:Uncharacterized protein n=1 Tax=Brevifollis gellanilyticus TaxID=748831 RepID=A0A512M2G7_9BACT|nr:hypothetical protein [Brevifollis gellanilyticus]GEP40934.1 hypothetical protein BGE01nite_02250 [Brevifollis gellanilyticus]
MKRKTLGQWGDHVQIQAGKGQTGGAGWRCPFCDYTFEIAARDSQKSGIGLARLAFMDHMEATHGDLVAPAGRSKEQL